jgi:hypothetical protein
VLVDLVGDPESPEASALVAEHARTLSEGSGGGSAGASSFAALARGAAKEKDVHRVSGVAWSTFGAQVGVALGAGCVLEAWRIRSRAAAGFK